MSLDKRGHSVPTGNGPEIPSGFVHPYGTGRTIALEILQVCLETGPVIHMANLI